MMKLLYVEDVPLHIHTMSKIAAVAGFELIAAETGKQAIAMLDHHPDLVLIDVGLPDISGFNLAAQIHALLPDTPIVATSAGGMTDDEEKALAAGCVDYVPKPFGFMEMVAYLKRFG